MFPISEYFRILVIGSAYQRSAELIEEKIGFRTSLRDSEDVAIVVGHEDRITAVMAGDARGICMPVLRMCRKTGSQSTQG